VSAGVIRIDEHVWRGVTPRWLAADAAYVAAFRFRGPRERCLALVDEAISLIREELLVDVDGPPAIVAANTAVNAQLQRRMEDLVARRGGLLHALRVRRAPAPVYDLAAFRCSGERTLVQRRGRPSRRCGLCHTRGHDLRTCPDRRHIDRKLGW
jgi:hypothetical protein